MRCVFHLFWLSHNSKRAVLSCQGGSKWWQSSGRLLSGICTFHWPVRGTCLHWLWAHVETCLTGLEALRAQANDLPSVISRLPLINSCSRVLSWASGSDTGSGLHWAASRSACSPAQRSIQVRGHLQNKGFFFFPWSHLADPETESVTPYYTMHLHASFWSVQW